METKLTAEETIKMLEELYEEIPRLIILIKLYVDLQDAIREALRDLFKKHDLHPFKTTKPTDCPEP